MHYRNNRDEVNRIMCLQKRAMAYVEMILAVVILGSAIYAGLSTYGAYARGAFHDQEWAIAQSLAAQLAAEIRAQAYSNPDGTAVFGPESDEITGTRDRYDDVDDYNGWNVTPPQRKDGTVMMDYDGYRQTCTATSWGNGKKIVVRIFRNGRLLTDIDVLRTAHNAETH